MKFKEILKNKKTKNILITLAEIAVVAGIIFGVLMFIQNKVSTEADKISGVDKTINNSEEEAETKEEFSDDYYIEVNMKKSAVIVYRYSKDKKTKNAYKVFACAVGEDLKEGKYKTSKSYSWHNINGSWHRYNTKIGKALIYSAGYSDKYANTLKKSSYREIGAAKTAGNCIMLYAGDAAWIYAKCKENTVVKVVKGKKSDKLPLEMEKTVGMSKYCGWDPTDSDKDNPYKKITDNSIVSGSATVYVEKGSNVNYLNNLLARNEKGKNIAGKLKYKTFDSMEMGTHKVKFSYKTKAGKKLSVTQKFIVIDTTCPVVTSILQTYIYEVKSLDPEDMNKKSNVKDIENLVRAGISCNESDVTITVTTLEATALKEGLIPVMVKAQDSAGNIGSCQVMCEIKVKKTTKKKKYEPTKEQIKKLEKQRGINQEETTKKAKTKKKKTSEKETTTEAPQEEETTTENQ